MMMKRVIRHRSLAILAGLCIGWYVAGILSPYLPSASVSFAEASAEKKTGEGVAAAHENAAEHLVPQEPMPWLVPTLWGAAALFVAALVLGFPTMKLRGPDPPDPAEHH